MTLIELLREKNIQFRVAGEHHHVTSNDWIGVDCPYCSPGWRRFRLGLTLDGRSASCWTCGRHPPIQVIAELTGLKPGEVFGLLDFQGILQSKQEATQGKLEIPSGLGPLLKAHLLYLKDRGFDPEEIQQTWGVKGLGIAGNLSWRLWIPIFQGYELVSWTTRSLIAEGKRYINAASDQEKIPAKSLLYGEHLATRSVIVVEGPLDAWKVGPGAVATFGIKWTHEQAIRLAKYARRVIVFDSEPEAARQARKLVSALEAFPGQTILGELETGKDPGDCSAKEIQELRRWLE